VWRSRSADEELPEPDKKDPWNVFDFGFTTMRLVELYPGLCNVFTG
jgi:hypothetical protein